MAFEQFKLWCSGIVTELNKKMVKLQDDAKLEELVNVCLEITNTSIIKAKEYGTIDTYAKKLALRGQEERLHQLKSFLSLFFTVWQDCDLNGNLSKKLFPENNFSSIDKRYFGLLTNILKKEDGNIVIPENVNFITWNYDTQLERALGEICGLSVPEIFDTYTVYPFVKEANKSKIIHLNGIAGIYKSKNEVTSHFIKQNIINPSPINKIKKSLGLFESINKKTISIDNTLTFAWEMKDKTTSFKAAQDIMLNTDVLVVIGYSFPNFNNEIDKTLIAALQTQKTKPKIYYQDLKANKTLLNKRFNFNEDFIEIDNENLNQFLIPIELS